MRIFESVDALRAAVGQHIGYSEWHEITQERINLFADATEDHQWIHVDEQAAAAGPFGTTIAHGHLTLSLLPVLTHEVWFVDGVKMGVNYGLNKVRFPAPVPVGSRLRGSIVLKSVEDVPGGLQVINEVTIEREGEEKPACVAETVSRFYL
ncbi:MAG TPA: MaoC family dehydratase [Micromonosporaceae bacterium]|jgi:acyl dehydratase